MDSIILRRGGTARYRVRQYATTDALQADSAPDNTIGIVTDVAFSDHRISPFLPSLEEGEIWIQAGSGDVSFEALPSIEISPVKCRQSVSAEPVWRDGYIRKDGAWVKFSDAWDGYYFNAGEQYTDITGGWTSKGYSFDANPIEGSVGETLSVSVTTRFSTALVGTVNNVDLTYINRIIVTVSSSSSPSSPFVGTLTFRILDRKSSATSSAVKSVSVANKTGENVTIDVSDLSGEYYLALCATSGSSGGVSAAVSAVRAK